MSTENTVSNQPLPDFTVSNHGSVILLSPVTNEAEQWAEEHIDPDAQRWGRASYVVEPRYIAPILEGIVNHGLTFKEQ